MLLIKTKPTTPAKRWMFRVVLEHVKRSEFTSFWKHKTLPWSKNLSGLKHYKKKFLFKFSITKMGPFPFFCCYFGYSKYPLREYILAKTLYNQSKLFLNTELAYPGFKFADYKNSLNLSSDVNQLVTLDDIPLAATICYVFNCSNSKVSFARSSGVKAIRRKNQKKSKLVYVELPSQKLILLPTTTGGYLTSVKNLFLNKIVLGKWGSDQKNKRRLFVRGVAKNPVDHPNGGRTKAKQPELSPWGWIAKNTK